MTPHDLIAAFDTLADAPDGIQRLRELVLQLAVRGKLVPQDENDGVAEIRADGQSAAARRSRRVTPQATEGPPFDLPDTWRWFPLREVAHDCGTKVPDRPFTYIDVGSIDNRRGVIGAELSVIDAADAPSRARKLVRKGTVIYSTVRPYLLNIAVVDRDFAPEPIVSTAFAVLHPRSGVDHRFLYLALRSSFFVDYVSGVMKGVAYPAINDAQLKEAPVPIPPLAEQHRIVARVDELMSLLDRLEAARTTRDDIRRAARDAALAALRDAPDPEAVETAWSRIARNMDTLFTTPDDVPPLRQAILQLAVRGRLIPQDSDDETAAALLGAREIYPSLSPWGLPTGWSWSTIEALGQVLGGGTPSKANATFWEGDLPWVSPKDMKVARLSDSQDHVGTAALEGSAIKLIPSGSLLMVVRGMILAHSFPVAVNDVVVTMNQDMKALVPFRSDLAPYLLVLLQASRDRVLAVVERSTHGTCKLPFAALARLTLPIPPLAEQLRIVAKVDALMAVCDELETCLGAEGDLRHQFAAAAVHDVEV